MEVIEQLKPQIHDYNIKVKTACAASMPDIQATCKLMEHLAVRGFICVLIKRNVFDRTKHKTLVELVNGLNDCNVPVKTFLSWFVEEYLDGLASGDEEDFPEYETIEAAREDLMQMLEDELGAEFVAS